MDFAEVSDRRLSEKHQLAETAQHSPNTGALAFNPNDLDVAMNQPDERQPDEPLLDKALADDLDYSDHFRHAIVLYRALVDGEHTLVTNPKASEQHASPVKVDFLNEGGANICFRMSYLNGPRYKPLCLAGPGEANVSILRMRKAHAAKGFTNKEVYEFHQQKIIPLFRVHTEIQPLQYELIRLSRDAIVALNRLLHAYEVKHWRDIKRVGDQVSETDPYALIMEDFSGFPPYEFNFEFKPKWLVQSPSAPLSATHCRNCAIHARRYVEGGAKLEYHPDSVCPLTLLSGRDEHVNEQARIMYSRYDSIYHAKVDGHAMTRRLPDFFHRSGPGGKLLRLLGLLQKLHDPMGIIQLYHDRQLAIKKDWPFDDQRLKDLALAMTLRDCSLLICVPSEPDKPIRACIADLDPKPWEDGPVSKLRQWRDTELALIQGGYYVRNGRYPWNCELNSEAMLCALQYQPYWTSHTYS